jgi:hypothetical protein
MDFHETVIYLFYRGHKVSGLSTKLGACIYNVYNVRSKYSVKIVLTLQKRNYGSKSIHTWDQMCISDDSNIYKPDGHTMKRGVHSWGCEGMPCQLSL